MLDPGKTGRLFPEFFLALQWNTLFAHIARAVNPFLYGFVTVCTKVAITSIATGDVIVEPISIFMGRSLRVGQGSCELGN